MSKQQRIRDSLHDLITFEDTSFEQMLWKIVQTPEFQRLRRIKQLGFSEMVFPGATHTRFAHSLGVYHIAKQLIQVIKRLDQKHYKEHFANYAIAAALVHDIGHGPFSHAFEDVGKELNLKMAKHETVSQIIIKERFRKLFDNEFGLNASDNIALFVGKTSPTIYNSIVSSQFDADRLDYMQRDRLMTGTRIGGIDFTWLIANIEIEPIKLNEDQGDPFNEIRTFVLNSKALQAAESYVLGLFQLYQNVYFHKTTRCAEKIFSQLLIRLFRLVRDGSVKQTGLPENHPLINFCNKSDNLDAALALDDTVIMGALSSMEQATDKIMKIFSSRIRNRKLLKCVDIGERLAEEFGREEMPEKKTAFERIGEALDGWISASDEKKERILLDKGTRLPYKKIEVDTIPMNQIWIRKKSGKLVDVTEYSQTVNSLRSFSFYRAYYDDEDKDAKREIDNAIDQAIKGVRP
ncbi:MAG: HD domain-containing protein [Helicobacteraceae bacterium]|jgi:HD superfamily phosphohydrolase|nr:HD domain-containing protein [Helicobacteraceae bacterium]